MTKKIEDTIEVLKEEIKGWQDALMSYEHAAREEAKDEGLCSLETQADMDRANEKIAALNSAISSLQLLPELVGALIIAEDLISTAAIDRSEEIEKIRKLISKAKAEGLE